jgi:hypothetical protein
MGIGLTSDELDDVARHVRQLESKLAAALRERDALRAMLGEILALEDVESPSRDGSENAASVVGDALEHLRRERDEALAAMSADTADVALAFDVAKRERDEARAAIRDVLDAAICECGDHCQADGALCVTCARELRAQLAAALRERDILRTGQDDLRSQLAAAQRRGEEMWMVADHALTERDEARVQLDDERRTNIHLTSELADARRVAFVLSQADGSGADLNAWMSAWEAAREWGPADECNREKGVV